MRTKVKNRLTMTKAVVSARMESGAADKYAWIWVDPLRRGGFRVSTVRIPKEIIDNDVSFGEPDIDRVEVGEVADINDVDDLIRGQGVDPDELDAPWYNKFPF